MGDPQPAAEGRAVADRDEHRLELHGPRRRARACRAAARRPAARPAWPGCSASVRAASAIRLARSLTLESKPAASTVTKCWATRAAQVDAPGAGPDDDVGRGLRVRARDAEVAGHVVAGAGGDDPQSWSRCPTSACTARWTMPSPPTTTRLSTPSATQRWARSEASSASCPVRLWTAKPASLRRGSASAAVRLPRPLPDWGWSGARSFWPRGEPTRKDAARRPRRPACATISSTGRGQEGGVIRFGMNSSRTPISGASTRMPTNTR